MNKYLLLLSLLLVTNIFAKETPLSASIAFVGMGMDYREYGSSGELLDSEDSSYLDMGGIEVGLAYILSQDATSASELQLNYMTLAGATQYIGSFLGSGQPYGSAVSTTYNEIIDIDVVYKRSKKFKNNISLDYGVGIGYREWKRALSVSQVEVYSWYSLRPIVGVRYSFEKFNLGISMEYQYGIDTKMSASDLGHVFTLGGADILELSFPISYRYDKNIDFTFETVMQKQTISESDRLYASGGSGYYYEPKSTAYNSYVKFGIGYKF